MDIVYNCDDGYMKYTAVSICSLFENNKEEQDLNVYILGNRIAKESKVKLNVMAESYGRKVSFYELVDFEKKLKELVGENINAGKFTITALARLFAAEFLPQNITKLLYIDCDTVILKSLRELFDTELGGFTVAMAAEPTIYPQVKQRIGLAEEEPYFNAGMILIDTEAWRRQNITHKAMEYYRLNNGSLPFSDQDLINNVLKKYIKPVSQKYNFLSNYYYQNYKELVKQAEWFKGCVEEKEWNEAKASPVMVHFAGDERPWIKGNFNPYRRQFLKYKKMTPWRDEEEIGGKRLYMFIYHMMNVITRLCPPIRKLISDFYYRKIISD